MRENKNVNRLVLVPTDCEILGVRQCFQCALVLEEFKMADVDPVVHPCVRGSLVVSRNLYELESTLHVRSEIHGIFRFALFFFVC